MPPLFMELAVGIDLTAFAHNPSTLLASRSSCGRAVLYFVPSISERLMTSYPSERARSDPRVRSTNQRKNHEYDYDHVASLPLYYFLAACENPVDLSRLPSIASILACPHACILDLCNCRRGVACEARSFLCCYLTIIWNSNTYGKVPKVPRVVRCMDGNWWRTLWKLPLKA